jgi:NAD(P)H dehydrogenase (quinone)
VREELAKVKRADVIIFQFPIWWWAPPAILKGWFDRVWIYGGMYSSSRKFEAGPLQGKRAMLSVTLGASADAGSYNGNEGDTMLALWPLLISLRYVGLSVLPPLRFYGVHGGLNYAQSETLVATQKQAEMKLVETMKDIRSIRELPFNVASDFDDRHRLKPGATAHTPYIRHREHLDL